MINELGGAGRETQERVIECAAACGLGSSHGVNILLTNGCSWPKADTRNS